jgi:hypothetical protein
MPELAGVEVGGDQGAEVSRDGSDWNKSGPREQEVRGEVGTIRRLRALRRRKFEGHKSAALGQ